MRGLDRFRAFTRSDSPESRRDTSGPVSREEFEWFLVATGLFLAALVWFWISLRHGSKSVMVPTWRRRSAHQ